MLPFFYFCISFHLLIPIADDTFIKEITKLIRRMVYNHIWFFKFIYN